MVRSLHKTKILFAVATVFAMPALILSSAKATNPETVQFKVNIAEALTLTITDPTNWASGELTNSTSTTGVMESDFLRNKVNVEAKSNSGVGIKVSMYTKGGTDLRNTISYSASDVSTSIPTLASATSAIGTNGTNFPTNYWGYSIDDTDTLNTASVYNPLSTSAIPLIDTTSDSPVPVGVEQDIDVFFGAKADNTKQSGTYMRTVYFAAVTANPVIPTDPSEPDPINNAAHYDSTAGVGTAGQTTYTTRSTTGSGSSATDSTSTEVTSGDISTTYAQAYGVTSESNGSALATAFGVAAGVAATSGIAFFVAAKRRKDDDDEEGTK